ncbi:MAG: MBL fold metallo-hydrolase [Christensenellaceae bacterium]|nr:MBL fold metallo-hydrolase [Christensenellaceae bacterium]
MNFIPLGVDAAYPKADGACSSYLIYNDDTKIVLDLGTASLAKLVKLVDPLTLDALFISHWHADHCSDIFSLSYFFQFNADEGTKLKLYTIADNDSYFYQEALKNKYFDVINVNVGDLITVNNFKIKVGSAKHPIKSVMFRVEEDEKSLVYTGDTNYFDGLSKFFNDVDVLIIDACFTHDVWSDEKPHLSAKLSAQLANEANVKKMILTHSSPILNPYDILYEAKEGFKNSELIQALKIYKL